MSDHFGGRPRSDSSEIAYRYELEEISTLLKAETHLHCLTGKFLLVVSAIQLMKVVIIAFSSFSVRSWGSLYRNTKTLLSALWKCSRCGRHERSRIPSLSRLWFYYLL